MLENTRDCEQFFMRNYVSIFFYFAQMLFYFFTSLNLKSEAKKTTTYQRIEELEGPFTETNSALVNEKQTVVDFGTRRNTDARFSLCPSCSTCYGWRL